MQESTATPVVCRVHTPRLLLRALHPRDAEALCRTIAASLEHLQRWMEWARHEPQPLEAKVALLKKMRARTLRGPDAAFGMFTPDEGEMLGTIGLHARIGAGALEIGYWIAAAHARRGYVTEAAGALVKIGFELHRLHRMEIHTDPDNRASLGVARKLGFQHQVVVRQRVLSPTAPARDTTIWALTQAQYAASPAATMKIEAYDRRGARVL